MDILENITDDFKENFTESIDSKMNVKVDYEKKSIDLSWLDIFEETLRYIDNILRNPKRFIINEEEIVKVELSKKVTVESVIHLTQHTNLISDYDPVKGDVRPSKILNINKEESLDTYENRFIYTLIKQMNYFIYEHEKDLESESYLKDFKSIEYDGNTIIDNEKINLSLKLDSNNNQIISTGMKNGVSAKERLKNIKVQMKGFMLSELMQTLEKLHVAIVRPPIRKTNVILKNPNFIKAVELWNYIQNYDKNNFSLEKDNQNYMAGGLVKEKFDECFLLNYLILNSITTNSSKHKIEKVLSLTINKVIDSILDDNEDITKKELDELVSKEYKKAKEKIKYRDEMITNILSQRFEKNSKAFNNACKILKEG